MLAMYPSMMKNDSCLKVKACTSLLLVLIPPVYGAIRQNHPISVTIYDLLDKEIRSKSLKQSSGLVNSDLQICIM